MKDQEVAARPPLIACVDDDASVREAIEGLLLASRFRVVTFDSAEAMLQSERLDSLSCLIADVKLGGKSGLELQRDLLAMGHAIPTIIITAFFEEGYRGPAMKAGAVAFLPKPISSERLLSAVNTALGRG